MISHIQYKDKKLFRNQNWSEIREQAIYSIIQYYPRLQNERSTEKHKVYNEL